MCLMAYLPKGTSLSKAKLLNAYSVNPDGFGLMYAENGRVKLVKDLFNSLEILKLYQNHKDKNLAIHFRYSTSGTIDAEHAHPFKILDHDEDGVDLFMAHNGVLQIPDVPDDTSDTRHFIEQYLKPILKADPDLIHKKEFRIMLGMAIGGHNKLLFLLGNGTVYIVNVNQGFIEEGAWYSNQYSLHSPPAPYKGVRKGSKITSKDLFLNLEYDEASKMYYRFEEDQVPRFYPAASVELAARRYGHAIKKFTSIKVQDETSITEQA